MKSPDRDAADEMEVALRALADQLALAHAEANRLGLLATEHVLRMAMQRIDWEIVGKINSVRAAASRSRRGS